jgi:hypothetical protein
VAPGGAERAVPPGGSRRHAARTGSAVRPQRRTVRARCPRIPRRRAREGVGVERRGRAGGSVLAAWSRLVRASWPVASAALAARSSLTCGASVVSRARAARCARGRVRTLPGVRALCRGRALRRLARGGGSRLGSTRRRRGRTLGETSRRCVRMCGCRPIGRWRRGYTAAGRNRERTPGGGRCRARPVGGAGGGSGPTASAARSGSGTTRTLRPSLARARGRSPAHAGGLLQSGLARAGGCRPSRAGGLLRTRCSRAAALTGSRRSPTAGLRGSRARALPDTGLSSTSAPCTGPCRSIHRPAGGRLPPRVIVPRGSRSPASALTGSTLGGSGLRLGPQRATTHLPLGAGTPATGATRTSTTLAGSTVRGIPLVAATLPRTTAPGLALMFALLAVRLVVHSPTCLTH